MQSGTEQGCGGCGEEMDISRAFDEVSVLEGANVYHFFLCIVGIYVYTVKEVWVKS